MYKNIICNGYSTRFIETQNIPADATIVDYTWRYLNKNGTPDKRFNKNRKIPICLYSDYSFNSSSGLNERIATSKLNAFDNFLKYIKAIGQWQQDMHAEDNINQSNELIFENSKNMHDDSLDNKFSRATFYSLNEYSIQLLSITEKLKTNEILDEKLLLFFDESSIANLISFCVLFDLMEIIKIINDEVIDLKDMKVFCLSLISPKILKLNIDPLELEYESVANGYSSNSLLDYTESIIKILNKPVYV